MHHVLRPSRPAAAALALALGGTACERRLPMPPPPSASGTIVHLEDELDGAEVTTSTPPASIHGERRWSFAEPRPEWRVLPVDEAPWLAAVTLEPLEDATRVTLAKREGASFELLASGLVSELEPTPLDAWEGLLVRARTRERVGGMMAAWNVGPGRMPSPFFFMDVESAAPVFNDGSAQSYFLPLRSDEDGATLENVALFLGAPGPASLDLLSIELVPRGADFPNGVGVRPVTRAGETRHTLFAHAPASLAWPLRLPEGARLDLGLSCLPGDDVRYGVHVRAGGEEVALLEDHVADAHAWRQVSVDLSRWSGQSVDLRLTASADGEGAVALWGAPIVSGATPQRAHRPPNVVFYVIDGGGADLMSVYHYPRRTTPYLEELAREGVVFERAFSNATWTQPSTVSFMTGLQHSVLGGLRRGIHSTPVPDAAVTFAEHMRHGGYQTAGFTANPNAGRVIGLERGVDVFDDSETSDHSTSSHDLHRSFWAFRDAYPGEPYWVHFQTTDVHEPNHPVSPFAGLFVPAEERERLHEWDDRLFEEAGSIFGTTGIADFYDRALEQTGIDRQAYFNARRGLYDETMAHQDEALRRFVAELKERGEWEHTLLVIGADHGHPAGTFARFGRGLFDPQPPGWEGALFDAYATRVPLIFVWPGEIEGGRRIEQPVSMIDVLPTVLELVGLPPPEICQGRSLVPYLRGEDVPPREVILDEFRVDEASGELLGNLEIVDGRWGASLEIGPNPDGADATKGRHAVPAGGRWGAVHRWFPDAPRLLLYDLHEDPFALHAVNAEYPERVERYRRVLLERWAAHRALAGGFGEAGVGALGTEQLQQLRALGYVR